MIRFKTWLVAAVAAAGLSFGATTTASAATVLQMDLQNITASFTPTNVGDTFGLTASGTVDISMGWGSLEQILIQKPGNPAVNQGIASGLLKNVTGEILLSGGTVTGGFLNIVALEEAGSLNEVTYAAQIVANSGSVSTHPGQGFKIAGLTFSGSFSDVTFAGVDVTKWFENSPLSGDFLNFAFNPNSSGVDSFTGLQVWAVAVVPTPAAAASGLALLSLLGVTYVVRRRRLSIA